MIRTGIALVSLAGMVLLGGTATAEPVWSAISISTTPSKAPAVLAATDKLMASAVGKEFPGRLLLQESVADGNDPTTHVFVPIYKTVADREAFGEKAQQHPAYLEFLATMEANTEPGGTVLYSVVKSWGDISDTDDVWFAFYFDVSDPAAFLAAIEKFLASETGKKFPGQVYLSAVVAGGLSQISHVISVGYASQTEQAAWVASIQGTADWAAYMQATQPISELLGSTLSNTAKTWGPATLKQLNTP